MKDLIERKLAEGKAQLDSAKIRYAAARSVMVVDSPEMKIESDNIKFWDGYLTALEQLKEEGE
jgi:hypothetical protein